MSKNERDYDEPMELIPSITDSDEIGHCLVIDTNIYLLDLKTVINVIDTFLPGKVDPNKILNFAFYVHFILIRLWLSKYCVAI